MRHAFPSQGGSSCGQEKLQAFDCELPSFRNPAGIKPQDAERQRSVDRTLGLLFIHT